MFFTDIFSTGTKIVPVETLPLIRCPLCGSRADAKLFCSDHTLRAFGVTVFRRQARCLAVCTSCKGVFDPSPSKEEALHQSTPKTGPAL